MILLVALAFAADPTPSGEPAPTPAPAPVAVPAPAPVPAAPAATTTVPAAPASNPPGFVPAVIHISTDPLLPQKYRSVPAGKYECHVDIAVSKEGRATDVTPTDCDQESFWALATAILEWDFDPATQNGVPVASSVPYTGVFEVRTLLPRKHVVGFVGVVASLGGTGFAGVDGRIHLGERMSLTGGVEFDRDELESDFRKVWTPVFHGDVGFSSPRQSFEHRGIYGMAVGAYVDSWGTTGLYGTFRGEVMSPVPGLSFGGDAGIATVFGDAPTYADLGVWRLNSRNFPFYPWLRASVIWYAPLPRDQFVVVPRADDPVVYEPIIEEPPPLADLDGSAFDGVPAWHWSQIEPSVGEVTPTGPAFDNYPPGSYRCNVRAIIAPDGTPTKVRAEACPSAGKADAEANVRSWRWPVREGGAPVQAVFPAPIFVRRDDAEPVRAQSVLLLGADGKTSALPSTVQTPDVYVHVLTPPVWTNGNEPTRSCFVDVDLSEQGAVLKTRWVSGDIEVQPTVTRTLEGWKFYPVAVNGELKATRVRLSMCDY